MFKLIGRTRRLLDSLRFARRNIDNTLFLTGQMASMAVRSRDAISALCEIEFRVSSQWGEDGIIEWLVHHLDIDTTTFVEFGVEDYRESNTRFLLQNRNWRGLVLDASETYIQQIKKDPLSWRHDLQSEACFITAENINDILSRHHMTGTIGLLSIDIDGNDYWIWKAISVAKPILVICEYNAVLGDLLPITIPYQPDFYRTSAHWSHLYYGSSISALTHLAREKNYSLLGSNRTGSNAFFVANDYVNKLKDRIRDLAPRPSFVRESRNQCGALNYARGMERFEAIADFPIVNVESGYQCSIRQCGQLYSQRWLRQLQT